MTTHTSDGGLPSNYHFYGDPGQLRDDLAEVIALLPVFVGLAAPDGRMLFLNGVGSKMLGLDAASVRTKRLADLCPPEAVEKLEKEAKPAALARGHWRGEIAFRHVAGHDVPTRQVIMAHRTPAGELRHFSIIAADITEIKKADEALRSSEAMLAAAQKAARFGSWEMDLIDRQNPGGNPVRWSDEMFRLLGHEPGAVRSNLEAMQRVVHPDDRAGLTRVIEQALQSGQTGTVEHRVLVPAVSQRYYRHQVTVVPGSAANQPGKLIGTLHDITASRLAADLLQEQATLLQQAHDAIIEHDMEGRISAWNKGAENIYGWPSADALGKNFYELVHFKDDLALHAYRQQLLSKGDSSGELQRLRQDGKEITVENRSTVIRDGSGHPRRVLVIDIDVTEKKRLAAHFLRAQRMESIGTLAGGIAHDLNNILSPILMVAGLLRQKNLDAEIQPLLDTLETSAQRGAAVVKQVLTFARGMEAGRLSHLNPKHLIREILSLIERTFPKSIQTEFRVDEKLWPIMGEATQLHQVLLNLSVNARDAMPNGGRLLIEAENVLLDTNYQLINPEAKPGPYVVLRVTDSGTGIPPDIRDKIFEPFFTTKEVGQGTGLGLTTVLTIVKGHKGFVHVYSEPRKGTTFKVYLPAQPEGRVEVAPISELRLPRGAGELVLIVDDEEIVRATAKMVLERNGYRVIEAHDGAEAVALYAQHQANIAVVLTDITMPIMDGIAVMHAIRRINPDARIIGASGLGSNSKLASLTGAGLTHFIPKPFTAEALLQILQKVLAPAKPAKE
jgi:PAS domain S-box-containing protein